MKPLTTYILNMPDRQERKASVEREFGKARALFDISFVRPVENKLPRLSHWLTFRELAERARREQLPCFIFCEDDHVFTPDYSETLLKETLCQTDALEADILLGGVSWMDSPVQVRDHLFWLNRFNGTQFVIVFNRFYDRILGSRYDERRVVTDFHISSVSDNIFVAYPFLSVQKEFGYSDVTPSNGKEGYVDGLFKATSDGLRILDKVRNFYDRLR